MCFKSYLSFHVITSTYLVLLMCIAILTCFYGTVIIILLKNTDKKNRGKFIKSYFTKDKLYKESASLGAFIALILSYFYLYYKSNGIGDIRFIVALEESPLISLIWSAFAIGFIIRAFYHGFCEIRDARVIVKGYKKWIKWKRFHFVWSIAEILSMFIPSTLIVKGWIKGLSLGVRILSPVLRKALSKKVDKIIHSEISKSIGAAIINGVLEYFARIVFILLAINIVT
ncbi:MAG: hypothetical protein ABIA04_15285 [Pseudomonadota bacterium]